MFCYLTFIISSSLVNKSNTHIYVSCRALPGMCSTSRGASVKKSPSHKIPEQLRTPKVPQVDNQILSRVKVEKYCLSIFFFLFLMARTNKMKRRKKLGYRLIALKCLLLAKFQYQSCCFSWIANSIKLIYFLQQTNSSLVLKQRRDRDTFSNNNSRTNILVLGQTNRSHGTQTF